MLHCDSQSAIQLAKNPVLHAKTKHVDVKYHFIKELIKDKQFQLVKVHTTENPADLLTRDFLRRALNSVKGYWALGSRSLFKVCILLYIGTPFL